MTDKLATTHNGLKRLVTNTNWSLLVGGSLFILTLFFVWQGVDSFVNYLAKDQNSKLSKIVIHGEPVNTKEDEIVAKIKALKANTFFDADVNLVQSKLIELPWVAQVSVRKQWPDTLRIYVTEHQAVAIWNQDLLLNAKGDIFQVPAHKFLNDLPMIYGPEGSENQAWKTFKTFKELFAINDIELSSLVLSERFSWQLWLKNGVKLDLGRKDIALRVQRFIDLYPEIKNFSDKEVESVDLRYDTGLAVSWLQSTHGGIKKNKV
jgi:cell division protein FtsQ